MVEKDFGKRLRGGLVFGTWAATLFYLALTDRTKLFLHPGFVWLLGIGAIIALGFFVAILRNPVPMPLSRTLILLIPLLHLAASDPASMGQDIFSKRFLSATISASENSRPTTKKYEYSEKMADTDTVPDEVINQGFANQGFVNDKPVTGELSLNILQLWRAPERHTESNVRLLGLMYTDAELEKHFGPGRRTALYRFVLTCCAADALPVTVALEGDIPELAPDQWVEVEGIFILAPSEKGSIPVVKVHKITTVDPPADPFLY